MRKLAVLAGVLAWLGTVAAATVTAVAEPTLTTPVPAMYVLAHARVDCRIDGFDEKATTTTGTWTDLTWTALVCLLNAVHAPADLPAQVVDQSPDHGGREWTTDTATWAAKWVWKQVDHGQPKCSITVSLKPKDSQR